MRWNESADKAVTSEAEASDEREYAAVSKGKT